jgi:hypothetical protein
MLDYEVHEQYVNYVLGLSPTIASGRMWNDPGDGIDRTHYSEASYPLLVDCKCTGSMSYSVKAVWLKEQVTKARELGKIFALPIRFFTQSGGRKVRATGVQDYILLPLACSRSHGEQDERDVQWPMTTSRNFFSNGII